MAVGQRLKALAAYQALKAQAKAVLGDAVVANKATIDVLSKAAVLAVSSKFTTAEVAIRAALLEASSVATGQFFFLFSLADDFYTADQALLGVGKGISEEEVYAVDQAIAAFEKSLLDYAITSEYSSYDLYKPLFDGALFSDLLLQSFGKTALDQSSTSDGHITHAGKHLSTDIGASEYKVAQFNKALISNAFLQDSLDRAVIFARHFTDSVDGTDDVNVSLLTDDGQVMTFSKGVMTYVGTDDVLRTVSMSKPLTDVSTNVDVAQVSYSKLAHDLYTALDISTLSFAKLAEDQHATADSLSVYSSKYLEELRAAVDNYASHIYKPESDAYSATDFLSSLVYKAAVDIFYSYDALELYFDKRLTDTVDATDDVNTEIGTDDEQVADFTKSRTDQSYAADEANLGVYKPTTDVFATSDTSNLNVGKANVDFAITADERFYALARIVVTFAQSQDYAARSINKTVYDLVSVSDSTAIGVGLLKLDSMSLSEVVDVVRIAATGVPPQSDPLNINDVAALLAYKYFSENIGVTDDLFGQASTDDDQVVSFGKFVSETKTVSEQYVVGLHRTNTESIGANDSGLLFWTDYCDITYFSQSYVGAEQTFT